MRTLKIAVIFLAVLALAVLLALNVEPQGVFRVAGAYPSVDPRALGDELLIDKVVLRLDPLGAGLAPTIAVKLPVLVMAAAVFGLIAGLLFENLRGRQTRMELKTRRKELVALKAELHQARQTLKEADHPSSAASPARR